jgi:catecholate siderophore receptor
MNRSPKPSLPALRRLALPAALVLAFPALAAEGDADAKTLPDVKVEADAERTSRETYQAVTTRIGKGNQELRDVPQSVTVVTERLISDRNLDTLKETLHNTAGISFLAAEGGEEDIRLRGFSLQASGDIFVDGLRDPAFYERDTFNYDRLEVLRGSASMLFGRGSTGGAVNQVSKEPFLHNQNEVELTLGSGGYARATGDFNLKTGDHEALRVNALWNGSDTYGTYGAGLDKKGLAAAYRHGIGMSDEFLVGLYHLDNHNGIHYGMPWLQRSASDTTRILVPADPKNYYGASSDYSAGSATYGTLGHVHRFQGGGELRTTFRAGHYERDQRASAIRFAAAGLQPGGLAVTGDTLGGATVLTRGSNPGPRRKNTAKRLQRQVRRVRPQACAARRHRHDG